jgi:hypothetical protein
VTGWQIVVVPPPAGAPGRRGAQSADSESSLPVPLVLALAVTRSSTNPTRTLAGPGHPQADSEPEAECSLRLTHLQAPDHTAWPVPELEVVLVGTKVVVQA